MCPGDEEVFPDAQPDIDPQPTPTYDENTGEVNTGKEPPGEIFRPSDIEVEQPEEFPLVPVAIGAGAFILIASLA